MRIFLLLTFDMQSLRSSHLHLTCRIRLQPEWVIDLLYKLWITLIFSGCKRKTWLTFFSLCTEWPSISEGIDHANKCCTLIMKQWAIQQPAAQTYKHLGVRLCWKKTWLTFFPFVLNHFRRNWPSNQVFFADQILDPYLQMFQQVTCDYTLFIIAAE